jgi:hypothetical protein
MQTSSCTVHTHRKCSRGHSSPVLPLRISRSRIRRQASQPASRLSRNCIFHSGKLKSEEWRPGRSVSGIMCIVAADELWEQVLRAKKNFREWNSTASTGRQRCNLRLVLDLMRQGSRTWKGRIELLSAFHNFRPHSSGVAPYGVDNMLMKDQRKPQGSESDSVHAEDVLEEGH